MKRKKLLSKAAAMMTAAVLVFGVSGQMVNAAEESAEQIGTLQYSKRSLPSKWIFSDKSSWFWENRSRRKHYSTETGFRS